jgi:hypothetical protein
MKKGLVLLAMVTVMLVGCSNNFKEQKFLGIKGNPKSIKDTKYNAIEKFGEVVEQNISEIQYYEFEEYGHILQMKHYNADGDIVYSGNNKFEDGKCIESKEHQKYNNISCINILKERKSQSDIWEHKYSDGRITTTFTVYEGQKVTTVIKDSDGNTIQKIEQQYDKNGNCIEYKNYGENQVDYWFISKFNEKYQEFEKKVLEGYDEGNYIYKYDSFDNKSNWTKKIEYKDGEIESLTIREIKY